MMNDWGGPAQKRKVIRPYEQLWLETESGIRHDEQRGSKVKIPKAVVRRRALH